MTKRIDEIAAVEACVQLYIDGANRGDTVMLANAFHSSAHMYGNYGDMEYAVPIGKFFDHVGSSEPPSKTAENHRGIIQSVELTGTAAVAKVVEENYQGADFVDYFFLMKFGADWKIVTKLFNKDDS
jgi:hypothetical protein|tara:strand:- start:198 stop:578 length:381 start_codon:yes stop_codon:yes gene_type:complete